MYILNVTLRNCAIILGILSVIAFAPGLFADPAQAANASQIINNLNKSLSCSPNKSKSCGQCRARCWSAFNRCVKTQCAYKTGSGKSKYCGSDSAYYGVRNDCAEKYASGSRGRKIKSCLAACN